MLEEDPNDPFSYGEPNGVGANDDYDLDLAAAQFHYATEGEQNKSQADDQPLIDVNDTSSDQAY